MTLTNFAQVIFQNAIKSNCSSSTPDPAAAETSLDPNDLERFQED
jgi:hypothetical protein